MNGPAFSMRTLALGVFVLLTVFGGCSGMRASLPSWTKVPLETTSEGLLIVGVSRPSPDERTARDEALLHALQQLLRHTGMEVSTYAYMIAREQGTVGQSLQGMDNQEHIQIATQGFVKKVKQSKWNLGRTDANWIAHVQVIIPVAEVSRMSQELEDLRAGAIAPYREALAQFRLAIAQHRIADALNLAPLVCETFDISRNLGVAPAAARPILSDLYQQALKGLDISPEKLSPTTIGKEEQIFYGLRLSHQGVPVVGLEISLRLPSGNAVRCVSGLDGVAQCLIPSPVHAGTYALHATPILQSPGAWSGKTLPLTVEGTSTRLSSGAFHDFLDAREVASVDPARFATKEQGRLLALQTARHLAYGRLLEQAAGARLSLRADIHNGALGESVLSNRTAGRIDAQVVTETVWWEGPRPVAEVTLRMPLKGNTP